MWEIVEVNTRYGIHAHVFIDVAFRYMTHVVVAVTELERYEGIEALGFVLQRSQLMHMVYSVAVLFYMPV